MLITIFGFLELSILDILDILFVAIIIFIVFRWIRKSSAWYLFNGIIFIYFFKILVDVLHMRLMSNLLSTFMDLGVLALIVIFQPEIRRLLMKFGSTDVLNNSWARYLRHIMGERENNLAADTINEIAEACNTMSEQRTGALIVLPHKDLLESIIETGDTLDARLNRRLIMNIFFKNSPLHDGAMVIVNNKIVAARCTLPISDLNNLPARYGMRHKAAIGVSEKSDADVIVVSEETGKISFVSAAKIKELSNMNELKLTLASAFSKNQSKEE